MKQNKPTFGRVLKQIIIDEESIRHLLDIAQADSIEYYKISMANASPSTTLEYLEGLKCGYYNGIKHAAAILQERMRKHGK